MPSANNLHRTAAVLEALDADSGMPPNARLWLALASMRTDPKGRTQFGAHGYAAATGDTVASGDRAVEWLNRAGLILPDHDDHGVECWRLTHHDWQRDNTPIIGGYGPDAGKPRDGLPPMYGRAVDDVIDPPHGNQNFPVPTWQQIAATVNQTEGEPR